MRGPLAIVGALAHIGDAHIVVYWSFRGHFQILCLVVAFIDTNKNTWLEKRTNTHFLTYCFMVKTNISKYKGAAIFI
jgi:hypothetical protein